MLDVAMASMQTIVWLTNDFCNNRFTVCTKGVLRVYTTIIVGVINYDMFYELKVSTEHVLHLLNVSVR